MATRNPIVMSIEGVPESRALIREFGATAERKLQSLVQRTAIRVQADAVRSIQRGPKSGRVYKRGNVAHRASAPGQAPATDTGALASSVARVDGKLTAAVGTGLEYGKHLEFGTTRMEARPWLIPALERNRAFYNAGVNKIIAESIQEIGKKAALLVKRLARSRGR
jgi:phage gpG-like protein